MVQKTYITYCLVLLWLLFLNNCLYCVQSRLSRGAPGWAPSHVILLDGGCCHPWPPQAAWHLISAGVVWSLWACVGFCCSDGVKDHFSLILVKGCITPGLTLHFTTNSSTEQNGFRITKVKNKWNHDQYVLFQHLHWTVTKSERMDYTAGIFYLSTFQPINVQFVCSDPRDYWLGILSHVIGIFIMNIVKHIYHKLCFILPHFKNTLCWFVCGAPSMHMAYTFCMVLCSACGHVSAQCI